MAWRAAVTRGRKLHPDERLLWRRVTRDVAPLRATTLDDDAEEFRKLVRHTDTVSAATQAPAPLKKRSAEPRGAKRNSADPFAGGDPKLDRRAARGRLPIDGALDLHGHTQATALPAIQSFLTAAAARGARCVIIVTGKGRGGAGEGILRRRFREWLHREELRGLVVRAAPAHARHGGDGAFYVFLKRKS